MVAPDDAGCVWAPEAIYDEETDDYLVYWASPTKSDHFGRQRIWAAHTKDFREFDKPFVFLEKPNDVIDIDITRHGDTYYRFTKDDKDKNVTMAISKKLSGPWQEVEAFTVAKGINSEGPIFYQLPAADGRPPEWCLMLDNLRGRARGYEPYITHDPSSGQFMPATDFKFPWRFRHGSVLPITTAELERLKAAYSDPQKAGQ